MKHLKLPKETGKTRTVSRGHSVPQPGRAPTAQGAIQATPPGDTVIVFQ